MKSAFFFLALLLTLPAGLSIAQTRPGSATTTPQSTTLTSPAVKPPATRPAAPDAPTPASSASSNRRQELYDQYHGITRKPATPAPVPAPTASRSAETTPTTTEPVSRPRASVPGDATPGIRIGLRGGVTYLVYTEKQPGIDPLAGFVGGVTLNFGKGTLSFQPELNYARYATKGTILGLGTISAAADVLEVPLFLKIASGTYEGNRFFINAGPYGYYVTSTSIDGKKQSLEGVKGRLGYGAAAGVGAALKAGPGHVTIEVRGLYQLGNTNDGFNADSKTIFTQAALGYIFPLGGQ